MKAGRRFTAGGNCGGGGGAGRDEPTLPRAAQSPFPHRRTPVGPAETRRSSSAFLAEAGVETDSQYFSFALSVHRLETIQTGVDLPTVGCLRGDLPPLPPPLPNHLLSESSDRWGLFFL